MPQQLTGVYAPALTPMYNDFRINYEEFANHCNDLINRGCSGVVLFGTTGEGTSFSVDERKNAIKSLIKLHLDPKKIIVGISCCAIDDAVQLTSCALEEKCSCVLLAPPFYYKNVPEEGVIDFYRNVIRKTSNSELKILLYHIPQHSGVPISLNIIKTLREEFPNTVIGIKESEGNIDFTKEILSKFPGFKVFVANDALISEAVQSGAIGAITGLTNAFPELICSLIEFGKDPQKQNNNTVIKNIKDVLKNYPILPSIKYLVEKQKGTAWHVLRPPLIPLNQKQRKDIDKTLEEIIFLQKPT